MQQILLPLFYNLQQIIRTSDFHRKYHLIFQSLDLSAVRDTNTGVGRTGYSRHAMLRAIRNQMTIAHLSMSLVAYAAAVLLKQPSKIRCYRTFAVPDDKLAKAS